MFSLELGLLLTAVLAQSMLVVCGQDVCGLNHWAEGTHPHPTDCNKYVTCNNFVTTIHTCSAGESFDPLISICRNSAQVPACNDQVSTVAPVTLDMRNVCYDYQLPNGIYPDPGSCSHYVECVFGNTYHLACPDGLEFDFKAKLCGEANRINCADNYHFSFTAHTG